MHLPSHPRFRFIRSQGDLDGACLLYSLANATQTLTGRQVQVAEWSAMIQSLSSTSDFLDNTAGSRASDCDKVAQEALARNALGILSPIQTLTVETKEKLRNGSLTLAKPEEGSVLVCANQQHWFCIVDSDDQFAYVACSWVWQLNPAEYTEQVSPRLHRVFNDAVPLKELEFFKNRALVVRST
jgi:hypothetical protein